jgi:hypothetical protein
MKCDNCPVSKKDGPATHANRYAHMRAGSIILLHPPPAELCQWWQGEPGNAGQPSKQRRRHRWWNLRCRLASSSAVPPSALFPGNIQMACACTMSYDARINGKCTCPPPCSSCLWTWKEPSSMPRPLSDWPCFQCSSCSLSSYCHFVLPLPLIRSPSLSLSLRYPLRELSAADMATIFSSPGDSAPQVPLVFR